MSCDRNWWKCQPGWVGKCKEAFKCMKESMAREFGEGAYERLEEYMNK